MLFHDITFIFPLLILFPIYTWLKDRRIAKYLLTIFSVSFYAVSELMVSDYRIPLPYFTGVVLFLIFISNKLLGLMEKDPRHVKRYFMCGLVAIFSPLLFIKYSNFVYETIMSLVKLIYPHMIAVDMKVSSIPLPIGISFITFQLGAYFIDCYYRKDEKKSNFPITSFIFFFPQLIAGPIMRTSALTPQLDDAKPLTNLENVEQGHFYFFRGIFKKAILGDYLATWVDPTYSTLDQHSLTFLLIVTAVYSFQIYFDFSGYSDMAVGLGKYFNINLMNNFNHPYLARSPQDFWRRWHISLSTWFRDYIFKPLRESRRPNLAAFPFAVFVTFGLSGLWHGASFHFLIWGLYHAFIYIVFTRLFNLERLPPFVAILFTFFLITLGLVLFRVDDISKLFHLKSFLMGRSEYLQGSVCMLIALAMYLLIILERIVTDTRAVSINPAMKYGIYAMVLIFSIIINHDGQKFIYFQF